MIPSYCGPFQTFKSFKSGVRSRAYGGSKFTVQSSRLRLGKTAVIGEVLFSSLQTTVFETRKGERPNETWARMR
jgi:hypothetical protein